MRSGELSERSLVVSAYDQSIATFIAMIKVDMALIAVREFANELVARAASEIT